MMIDGMAGKDDTNDTMFPVSPEVAKFYGIELTDDHVLEMAELLESVCPGLGDRYLDCNPDGEFQRDLLAGAKLFWERRKAPCQCACNGKAKSKRPVSRSPRPSSPSNGTGPTLLRTCRKSRGLSQAGLAKIVGSSQAAVWRWEHLGLQRLERVKPYFRANVESYFGKPFDELVKPVERPNSDMGDTVATS